MNIEKKRKREIREIKTKGQIDESFKFNCSSNNLFIV